MKFKDYIADFSETVWYKQATFSYNGIRKLKTIKGKKDYINMLYSNYLQLLENFIIFILVIGSGDVGYIFAESAEIKKAFQNHDSVKPLLDLLDRSGLFKSVDNKNEYKYFLEKSFSDYRLDKEFLNAYKHGYRVKENLSNIEFILGNKHVGVVDCGVHYLSVKYNGKNKKDILIKFIGFNSIEVYRKIIFICNIIKNLKIIYLNDKQHFKLLRLFSIDDNLAQSTLLRGEENIGSLIYNK